jgi:hypothetical protein
MKIAIKANINDRLFSAEYGGNISNGMAISANREEVRGFETFEEIKLPNGCFALKTETGHYLTADLNGELRTNATEIGAWENFKWMGSFIATFHGKLLTARIDKDFIPIETTDNTGSWEEFTRISLGSEVPVGRPDLDMFPRLGCSLANCFMANHYDYKGFASLLSENRMEMTGINLLSAQWQDMEGPKGTWPWIVNRPWDLRNFNQEYQDKLYEVISEFHSHNIHVILTILELYGWSNRKKGGGVPDANLGPWRNNNNGVRWGGKYDGTRQEDDATLLACPDSALKLFLDWMAPIWKINGGITIKIGNEYPEKELHERVRDYIRNHNPAARFMVNRNEDTPGQYQNMKIGQNYHMIDYHGWKSLSFLDKNFADEPRDRPKTFRQFFDKKNSSGGHIDVDFNRCIANSDGARANNNPVDTYNWDELFKVHEFAYNKGCSIDHQSQVKMSFDLDNIETAYLQRLANLKR